MYSLCRFWADGNNQLGRQKVSVGESVVGFMMKFNSIDNTIVQAEGYDVVEDLEDSIPPTAKAMGFLS